MDSVDRRRVSPAAEHVERPLRQISLPGSAPGVGRSRIFGSYLRHLFPGDTHYPFAGQLITQDLEPSSEIRHISMSDLLPY